MFWNETKKLLTVENDVVLDKEKVDKSRGIFSS